MDEMNPMVELLLWTSMIALATFVAGIIDRQANRARQGRYEEHVGPADPQRYPHFRIQMRHRFNESEWSAILGWNQI